MAANTTIEYADHTANAWRGCSRVNTGCLHCYAAELAKRFPKTFGTWGPNGERVIADKVYTEVAKWNRKAASATRIGSTRPPIVFWNDVSDTFEDLPELIEPRQRMFAEGVDANENLIHLLVTKRPENIRGMWPLSSGGTHRYSKIPNELLGPQVVPHQYRENCWLLFSASDQASLEAGLPHLLACRDLAPVLGLSLEPLIGPVDFRWWYTTHNWHNCLTGEFGMGRHAGEGNRDYEGLKVDWVIIGGESGPRHRPMEIAWLESIAEQCAAAGVPLFVKQDCGPKPGQQGRIPDHLWSRKEFPK